MANDTIVKGIFQLDIDAKAVEAGLNKVAGSYATITEASKKQNEELVKLTEQENKLIQARAKAHNPTDIVSYTKKINDLHGKITALNTTTGQAVTHASNLNKAISGAFGTTQVAALNNQIKETSSHIEHSESVTDQFNEKLAEIASVATVVELGSEVIKVGSEFEKLQSILETTLGSKTLAKNALADIKEFAEQSSFSAQEVTDAYVRLTNEGFVPTANQLKKLGDLATVSNRSFGDLTEAILSAQLGSFKGLRDFGVKAVQQGDNVVFSFKGVKTTVSNTNDAIQKYIVSLGDAKGVSNAMAGEAKTLSGRIKDMHDSWEGFILVLSQGDGIIGGTISLLSYLIKGAGRAADTFGSFLSGNAGKSIQQSAIQSIIIKTEGVDSSKASVEELLKALDEAKGGADRLQKAGFDLDSTYSKATLDIVKDFHEFDSEFQKLANTITSSSTKAQKDNVLTKFVQTSKELRSENEAGKLSTSDYIVKVNLLSNAYNLAKDKVNLFSEAEKAGLSDEKKKQYEKELESLKKLREELIKGQSVNRLVDVTDSLTGIDQIQAKFVELQTQQDHEFDVRREQAKKDFTFRKTQIEAISLINKIEAEKDIQLQKEKQRAILNEEKNSGEQSIEISKTISDTSADIELESGSKTEIQTAEAKLKILKEYYDAKESLLENSIEAEKAAGLNSETNEKELTALRIKSAGDISKSEDTISKSKMNAALSDVEESERHNQVLLGIAHDFKLAFGEVEAQRRADDLTAQIAYENKKLQIMIDSGEATKEQIEKQQNKISEIQGEANKAQLQANYEVTQGEIKGSLEVAQAAINAGSQEIQAAINAKDAQIQIQQNRVEEAKSVADKGNAEQLKEEQKRLDDLNKEKQKFVREQQELAALQLVANATVAISGAAAEGGIAAPFTIAATLIALAAGLAEARALASQASFYDGGYTGDGNAKGESKSLGKRSYTYHNREFVFDHKSTAKYRDIFEDIHKGKLDLNDMRDKAQAFDAFKKFQISSQASAVLIPHQNNSSDVIISSIEKKLNTLTEAVRSQGMYVNMDSNGFEMHLKNIRSKNDFIRNKLAKP